MSEHKTESIFDLVCEHLPEDWKITIELERGCGCAELYDPTGELIDDFPDDDGTFFDHILERLNHARVSDGLLPIGGDDDE